MRLRHIAICLLLLPTAALAIGNDAMGGNFVVSGELAYFPAVPRADALELWVTDGTPGGTRRVADLGGGSVLQMVALWDGVAFFVSTRSGTSLWRADRNGAVRLAGLGWGEVTMAIARDGQLFFSAGNGPERQHRLWKSDGTAAGTSPIADLPIGVRKAVLAGNLLFLFLPSTTYFDYRGLLWRSDGTTAGTFSLGTRSYGLLGQVGTSVLYTDTNELWRTTDGTPETTELLPGIRPGKLASAGEVAYIFSGSVVWRTDGTVSGTVPLFYAPPGVVAQHLVVAGENFYFATQAGYFFHDVKSGQSTQVGLAGDVAVWTDGHFFFGSAESGLSVSGDPNVPAERLTTILNPATTVVPFGNGVLFSSDDGVHGLEPWFSDGTTRGTVMLTNLRPETTLRGSVLDAQTGRPVPGARLWLQPQKPCEQCPRQITVPTEDDGRFIVGLRDDDYFVTVYAGDYVTLWWPVIHTGDSDVIEIEILLQRGGGISGRVVDNHGAPVGGLSLFISSSGKERGAVTDADGTYTTGRSLDPGVWSVRTTDRAIARGKEQIAYSGVLYNGVPCWTGCDPRQGSPLVLQAGEMVTGIDFTVTPLGTIRGRVLDALTGQPLVTGWTVVSQSLAPFYTSTAEPVGADGQYEISLGDGGASLVAYLNGGAYSMHSMGPLFVAPGTTAAGPDLRLEPSAARIRGRVAGAQTGRPASGVVVSIVNSDGRVERTAVTGPDGRYETQPSLLPGTYTVQTPATSWAWAASATVSVSGHEIAQVDLPLDQLYLVTGIVRDGRTQQPLAGARIQLVDEDGSGGGRTVVTANAEGRYSLAVAKGSYVARAVKGGWYVDTVHVTVPGDVDPAAADFALAPACATAMTSPQTVFPAQGGTGRITLGTTCAACTFSNSSFLHLPSLCGTAGAVTFTVDPNPGAERTGWIVVPGGAVKIRQEGRRTRSVGR